MYSLLSITQFFSSSLFEVDEKHFSILDTNSVAHHSRRKDFPTLLAQLISLLFF